MSSFLELCQRVAFESGTVSGVGQPASTTNQVGRLRHVVLWTASAYTAIQNHRHSWLWLRDEFEMPLLIGTQRYKGSDLGIDRLAGFIIGDRAVSCYDPAIGVTDEGFLRQLPYDAFYEAYLVGGRRAETGKPHAYALDQAGRLVLYPTPDKAYVLHGTYRKTPQLLAANGDVPEMPDRFHELVVWKGLLLLAEYDESMNQFPLWQIEYNRIMSELETDQLPQITLGGALA